MTLLFNGVRNAFLSAWHCTAFFLVECVLSISGRDLKVSLFSGHVHIMSVIHLLGSHMLRNAYQDREPGGKALNREALIFVTHSSVNGFIFNGNILWNDLIIHCLKNTVSCIIIAQIWQCYLYLRQWFSVCLFFHAWGLLSEWLSDFSGGRPPWGEGGLRYPGISAVWKALCGRLGNDLWSYLGLNPCTLNVSFYGERDFVDVMKLRILR